MSRSRSRHASPIAPLLLAVAAAALLAPASVRSATQEGEAAPSPRLWYRQPAAAWNESLPVGNGRLGASVFGTVARERIVLNEETLWSGGPYDPSRDGGAEALPEIRRLLFAGEHARAHDLFGRTMMGIPAEQMKYQPLGNLWLIFPGHDAPLDYVRELDLDSGIARVRYRIGNTTYTREVLASAPDQVIVVRLIADTPGALSFDAELHGVRNPAHSNYGTDYFRMDGMPPSGLLLTGRSSDYLGIEGKLRYRAELHARTDSGTADVDYRTLRVRDADAVTLVMAAATNFVRYDDVSADPEARVAAVLTKLGDKGWDAIRDEAVADHRALFRRATIEVGPGRDDLPTDRRVEEYVAALDPGLAELYFQLGRYLLIASSRPGTEPANLQGIWNDNPNPPWDSKYTVNINLPMNYWPADTTHLGELVDPLFKLVSEVAETGRSVARRHYGARGWVLHQNTDLFRAAAPMDGPSWGTWPTGGAWLTMNLWDHWRFERDPEFLARLYPLMRDQVRFLLDILVEDPETGWLVTAPSNSPENFPATPGNGRFFDETSGLFLTARTIAVGPTIDLQIIRALLGAFAEASVMQEADAELRQEALAARERLAPNQIGSRGQLQEWLRDWEEIEPEHRHLSHLWGLYPGDEITPEATPELAAAARRSIELRGPGGCGWSGGWKVGLWARLHDGERALGQFEYLINDATLPNLLSRCGRELQVDGNFGATASIAEMLLQSHDGTIALLPALPGAWAEGSFAGLRARGGFEVDAHWSAGRLERATLRSRLGGVARVRSEEAIVVESAAGAATRVPVDGVIEIETEAGQSYSLGPAGRSAGRPAASGATTARVAAATAAGNRTALRESPLPLAGAPAQEGIIPPAPSPTSAAERAAAWAQHERMRTTSPLRDLPWRAVGPRVQGGRVEAIAVDPRDSAVIYVGAGAGNLWKTDNAGTTWRPIMDRAATFSIGDVALAPSNPDVVWVGTGEVLMARSSYAGNGVYRSTDGGDSWSHVGLADSHHIAKVVVHPDDPDTAWVAAVGHLFSFNEERGVFRTTDGGESWERTLYVNERTGAIDLVADPTDPEVLYAAMWEHSRRAWGHTDGGEGSGIYRSVDGGRTWQPLVNGFPSGPHVGRIGLAVAPSRPSTVYALMVDRSPGERDADGDRIPPGRVFRSDDGGDSWVETGARIPAGYDFCLLRVDPTDPERVYSPGQVFWSSDDGGRSFSEINGTIVHLLDHEANVLHLDQHEMWIDPEDGDHLILGNDGGVYVTHDRGITWLHLNNLPIAEFYAVDVDMAEPYNIWGGTQDDAALYGPAARIVEGGEDPWKHVYIDRWGGGDSYFTYPHPIEPWVVFYEHQFGALRRKDLRDDESVDIQPGEDNVDWGRSGEDAGPAGGEGPAPGQDGSTMEATPAPELRFNWMSPFLISAFDADTLYFGTQYLMRSRDRGDTWEPISPDLTTDPGPERRGNVPYGTLTSVSESPLDSGLLWTGSDDGRVHVTTDGGVTWSDVTGGFRDLWVSRVVASRHVRERAYVTLTGYREDDTTAHVYVTEDLGATWRSIAGTLPAESVNVIDEDPERADLLFVGTDLGVYASLDRGATWHSLVGDLPATPVVDLVVHPRDGELVIGTHGRSAFVLDVLPLRALTDEVARWPLHLFEPRPAVAPNRDGSPGAYRVGAERGEATITWWQAADTTAVVEVLDVSGTVVWRDEQPGHLGLNVARWDLLPIGQERATGSFDRYPEYAAPGTYTVRVIADGGIGTTRLIVLGP